MRTMKHKILPSSILSLIFVTVLVIAVPGVTEALAANGSTSARGGGLVGGSPGLTFGASKSQFGFTASASGGQFQCLMAGRSGGFSAFGLIVLAMDVHGNVTPGSLVVKKVSNYVIHDLTVSGLLATFSGMSTVKIVGRAPDGSIVTMTMELEYNAEAFAGGAGTAVLHLHHPGPELDPGGIVESGQVKIRE